MRYQFIIDSKIERLDSVYRWLESLLKRRKIDCDLIQKILFVSQEITTNAILHGNRKIPTKRVHIILRLTPKRVILNISDEGSRIFRLPTKKQATKLDYLKECGRGLKLTVLMSDRVVLANGGIEIYFNIK
jgi:anti-sigma regulatory factor (Ser/Thr protein kinase)